MNCWVNQPTTPTISFVRVLALQGINTAHEVSEAALLRDLLFVFQGIDGTYVRFDPVVNAYIVDPNIGVPTTTRNLIGKLSELGWLYSKVSEFVTRRSKHQSAGAVERALCSALNAELQEYFRLISVLEGQLGVLTAPPPGGSAPRPTLTLRRLVVWTQDPIVRMRTLAVIVDACRSLHGGAIASVLHKLAKHGDVYVLNISFQSIGFRLPSCTTHFRPPPPLRTPPSPHSLVGACKSRSLAPLTHSFLP